MTHLHGDYSQIKDVFSPLANKASKKTPTKSCGKSTVKAALAELNTASNKRDTLFPRVKPGIMFYHKSKWRNHWARTPLPLGPKPGSTEINFNLSR